MAYSDQTVAQLKEELTKRELSTTGVKSVLIARLEEDDSKTNTVEAEPEVEQESESTKVEESITEDAPVETTEDVKPSEEKKEEEDQEPKPKSIKEFTPEERKALAIEFLNKKITRAKKFGTDDDIEAIEKDLKRVEKFGVELGTSLAKEIGLTKKETLDGGFSGRKKFRGGHRGKFRKHRR